jgi:hypothetical protein
MSDSIKLTDAIAGNRNWLDRAKAEHSDLCKRGHALLAQADRLHQEMLAREKMADAMDGLQRLMPADETIKFLVPR